MPREPQDVTEAELSLLEKLWDGGRASIRQLADAIYPGGGAAQYATIQKQLERLEAKGFVSRDRSLYVHVFTPSIDRDELIGRRIRAMAEKLCEGSLVPILNHLVRSKGLSQKERQALRELIESPEPSAGDRRDEGRREGGRGGKGKG